MIVRLLYDLLIGVPLTLGKEVLIGIKGEIEKQGLMTEESIKVRLQELQLLLQDGELSEEEYEGMESQLMGRLREVREYQSQQG